MARASLYVVLAGVVWMAEGYFFSRLLGYRSWQTALLAAVYLGLFVVAAVSLYRARGRVAGPTSDLPAWRLLSLAPMLVVIVGSFVSLPILVGIAALGRLV